MPDEKTLFCFGYGFSAQALAARLSDAGWHVIGTVRQPDETGSLHADLLAFDSEGNADEPGIRHAIRQATHILVSVKPDANGDPVLNRFAEELISSLNLRWLGYLSTTGVYGDRAGGWVDESSELAAQTERGTRRIKAERAWLESGLPIHIFRLAGIYGPGRTIVTRLRAGMAKRVIREGQVFSRIHVSDVAQVLAASIARPNPGATYNVADDEPTPPQLILEHAAELLGIEPPPAIPFEEADLSPMARSFYADSKRVRNDRIKQELGVVLQYPNYREGLAELCGHFVDGSE